MERARLNVIRAIRSAIARVAEHDEALGEHLSTRVHTGRVCAYRPDREAPVAWTVSTRPAPDGLRHRVPAHDTRYARNGEISIAYQVVGEGPIDLVLVNGLPAHLDLLWADPDSTAFLRRLASFSRLILFDKPGTGLSDPVAGAPYLTDEMYWFCKPHPNRRTHHLHLAPISGRRYRDELDLRNRLRANADLKRSLARRFEHDREGYTQAKSAFIGEALAADLP